MKSSLQAPGLAVGVHDGIPNADYHSDPAVGSTTLRQILDDKNAGLFTADGHVPIATTDAMNWGTVLHSIVLEGVDDLAVVLPYAEFRTAEAKAAKAEVEAAGKIALKPHEWAPFMEARDAILSNPYARALLTGGVSEQTLISKDPETGLRIKARPDHRTNFIADLKTTRDANPRVIERTVIPDYGYQLAAAHYQRVVADTLTDGELLDFYLVCVEKTHPYRVSVVQVGEDYLADGRQRYRRALDLYAHGLATGEWPTWPTTYTAEPPAWLLDQTTRLTEGAQS